MAVATAISTPDTDARVAIGLSAQERQGVVDILNTLLADEMVLYQKTRNYHWNVRVLQFDQLHKFFEMQYDDLANMIDEVAERTRALGGFAVGTLEEFKELSRLAESPGEYPSAERMISNLLTDQESIIRSLRKDQETCMERFHDVGTNDFLVGLMERHEKMAWMLRAFVAA